MRVYAARQWCGSVTLELQLKTFEWQITRGQGNDKNFPSLCSSADKAWRWPETRPVAFWPLLTEGIWFQVVFLWDVAHLRGNGCRIRSCRESVLFKSNLICVSLSSLLCRLFIVLMPRPECHCSHRKLQRLHSIKGEEWAVIIGNGLFPLSLVCLAGSLRSDRFSTFSTLKILSHFSQV